MSQTYYETTAILEQLEEQDQNTVLQIVRILFPNIEPAFSETDLELLSLALSDANAGRNMTVHEIPELDGND